MPRVQSKISCVVHAHRGAKLLEDLRNQGNDRSNRAMERFRGARERAPWHLWNTLCQEKLSAGVWDHTTRWNQSEGLATAMVAGRRPPASTPSHVQRRDEATRSHPNTRARFYHLISPSSTLASAATSRVRGGRLENTSPTQLNGRKTGIGARSPLPTPSFLSLCLHMVSSIQMCTTS